MQRKIWTVSIAIAALFVAGGGATAEPGATPKRVAGDNTSTGGHIAFEGDRLYMGTYGVGMKIFDISDPAAPRAIGAYTPGLRADTVPDATVIDGREIAILNGTRRVTAHETVRTDRTEFLDVSDPSQPRLIHAFIGQDDGEAHNGDVVDERLWWLPSGGSGSNGLRIYDLGPLANDAAPVNLFRGNPTTLWAESPYRGSKPVGANFTHTHDLQVYPDHKILLQEAEWVDRDGDGVSDPTYAKRDIVLLAEGGNYLSNAGDTGSVFFIDVTDPRAPVVINRWLHERGEGHHPIRYHHEVQFLDGDRSVMLVTDEDLHNGCGGAGGVVAVRLSPDLTQATELSEWFIPFGTPAAVCSVHVFSSDGDTVYIGSYNAGLQVVDYSNPTEPKQVASVIEPGSTAWGAYYRDGYVYVGDMSRGLDVYRVSHCAPGIAKAKAKGKGKATGRPDCS